MKYLTRREDFLRSAKTNEAKQDFLRNNRFTGLQAINEAGGPLSNDLGWGDSLLGRLINSFIRKSKIGYNATKVEPLLNALRSQLDILIANSLSRDTKNELNQLRIKSYLSELRNICTDDISETEKLDELIGGHEDLWDPRRQDGGLWSNVLTQGVLVDTHDFIENEIDKKDLEKAGIPRDGLLDQLSIFIDNLRRLTVSDRDPVIETEEQSRITFVTNFTNVVNAISVMSERNNMQYDNLITDFGQFITERSAEYVKTLKDTIARREEQLAGSLEDETQRKGLENELEAAKRKLKEAESKKDTGKTETEKKPATETGVAVIDQTPGKADPKRQLGTGEKVEGGLQTSVKKDDAKKIEAAPEKDKDKATNVADNAEKAKTAAKAVPNELGADSKSRWAKIKQLALKCVDKKFEDTEAILKNTDCVALIKSLASLTSTDLEYAMTKNIGKKIKIDDVEMPMDNAIEALVQKKDIEKLVSGVKVSGVRIKDSSKQIASNTKYTKDQKREILLKRLNRYKNKLAKKSNDEFSKTKIKELDVYLKQIGEGFTYPTGYERIYEEASGTASSVLDCWNNFVRDAEIKKDFLQITQREHDRLNGLLNGIDSEKTVLEYNLSENPDPIIAITRIFKRAHDLYYHDVIPSGRSNGAVSNKTFREYEKLGGGASSQTTQDNPGVGPWAVKSIRNKWTDGVMEILEDQNYRKILANIRFVVPGSEDTFNRATEQAIMKWNNFIKIFEEADVEDDKVKKSQGQILFDFINDMLSDEAAASFDKQRRILMKKYFGFKDDAISNVEKKDKNIPEPEKKPAKDDTVPKSMSWAKTEDFKSFGTSKYEGPFYAIPIEKKNDHRMLFLHLLKNIELKDKKGKVSNGYLIKYTFDQPAIMEKFIAEKHPGYKIETDWATGTAKVSYYGIVKAFPKGNFKVAYLNTSSKNISTDEFTLFNESAMDINAKKVTVYPAHLMITDDKNIISMIKTDFSTEVFEEKKNHDTLTDDLLNKLKEEAVK